MEQSQQIMKYTPCRRFPVHPSTSHENNALFLSIIQKMSHSYHNISVIKLEDSIQFQENKEYLKRSYQPEQFQNKISMLSQYYKFHQEMPRLFQIQLHQTISAHQEDKRNLQYYFVSKKMKNSEFHQEDLLTGRQKCHKPIEKIIKNIQLSYYNFQNKKVKKDKAKLPEVKQKRIKSMFNSKKSQNNVLFHYTKPVNVNLTKTNSQNKKIKNGFEFQKMSNYDSKNKNLQSKTNLNFNAAKKSVNSSIDSNKNLSRSKSRGNLQIITSKTKHTIISPLQEKNQGLNLQKVKARSIPNSIQKMNKVSSMRNIIKKEEEGHKMNSKENQHEKVLVEKKEGNGLKNMFKKIVQNKKIMHN